MAHEHINGDLSLEEHSIHELHQGCRAQPFNRAAVLALKAQGKTPAEATEILGLPRTTVSRYWQLED